MKFTDDELMTILETAYNKIGWSPKQGCADYDNKGCCPLYALAVSRLELHSDGLMPVLERNFEFTKDFIDGFVRGFDYPDIYSQYYKDSKDFKEGERLGEIARKKFIVNENKESN